ncbi:cupin domain-containing protein [Glycomyces paridis]|uniref:Cupin domain-containing protein n=1 Tax=Glycomyces paridis TaxID=2126555 RepID=A0A4S8P2I4_9ACTN|nr:cupin domain-containing protein [Glycomyces paridis]THV21759.1 cupin domain-containing protein [Glycomyces paridis]
MSYPEPKYFGDHGEMNAQFRPAGAAPDLTYPNGGTAGYLATGATTNGQFGLYQWNMSGARSGPDPHFHRTISESFYILSGSIRIYNGAKWVDHVPGDFVHVPEGGVHGFRNESGEPASMLLMFHPGAPREDYFEGLLTIGDMTDEERKAFFALHDNFWIEED